jgi:ribonuclease P protein component
VTLPRALRPKAGAPGIGIERLQRLLTRRDFLAVASVRQSGASPGVVVQSRRRKPDGVSDVPRVGYTASKKVGNAVARSRAKRRLRAAAALVLPDLVRPQHDYVLIARQGTLTRPWADLLADLRHTLKRLAPRATKVDSVKAEPAKSDSGGPRDRA